MAWEVNCVPLFAAMGLALLLRGFDRSGRSLLSISAAALLLATGLYTYAAYRAIGAVVVVFLLVTAVSSDRRVLLEKVWGLLLGGVAAALLLVPLVRFALAFPTMYWARYTDISLTTYMSYHSSPMPWLHQIGKALLSLNQRGDLDAFPFLDPMTGAMLIVGVAGVAVPAQRRGLRLLWCWFLVFAALSSLTIDSPHSTRMLGMLPPVALLAGLGATRFFDAIAILSARLVRPAAALVLIGATAVNSYWYFGEMQQLPEIDLRMNEGARRVCTEVAGLGGKVFWTDAVAYNCRPQCMFLLAAGNGVSPTMITLPDVLNPLQIKQTPSPVMVILHIADLEQAGDRIPRDENGDPILDFPVSPSVVQSREGKPMYFIYKF
jgi:hypothetical protein